MAGLLNWAGETVGKPTLRSRAVRWLDQQDVRLDQVDDFEQDLPRCFDGFRRVAPQERAQRRGEQRPEHVRGGGAFGARQDLGSHAGDA